MKKIKLATIVGTRPEIIRLAEIIKLADKSFDHVLIHTGQNYDYSLNQIFFQNLKIREPDYFLNVVGVNLGDTIGNIISKSYSTLFKEKPDALLVLGDTNSVLSTISAKRLKIPIFHMESGNRCFDQNVPEEINRKISDHISDINLAYTENSRRYLLSEGFRKEHIFVTGSPLYEVLEKHKFEIDSSQVLDNLSLEIGKYFVVSAHREENLEIGDNIIKLSNSLNAVALKYNFPIIFSMHPRTKKIVEERKIVLHKLVRCLPPFGFFDYIKLQRNAYCVLSDSGTISEEAAMANFPAVSIRTSTERPEAIDSGTIVLGGIDKDVLLQAIDVCINTYASEISTLPTEYFVKDVSKRVIRVIQSYTSIVNKVIWCK